MKKVEWFLDKIAWGMVCGLIFSLFAFLFGGLVAFGAWIIFSNPIVAISIGAVVGIVVGIAFTKAFVGAAETLASSG